MPARLILSPEQKARVAALEAAHVAWLQLAATVARNAEKRSIAWQERRIPERFRDLSPRQLPERLWWPYNRQEAKYYERKRRAAAHAAKADACVAEIRRIREEARKSRPKQTALFWRPAAPPSCSPHQERGAAMNTDWLYESTDALDLEELEKLGPARPLWTFHFTTWQAFKRYVAQVVAGKRLQISEWSSVEEFERAARELVREELDGSVPN